MDLITVGLVTLVLFILWLITHYYAQPTVHISDSKQRRHLWKKRSESQVFYCNICELLLNAQGFACEFCSVACDKTSCMKIADRKLKCKQQRERKDVPAEEFRHLFVKGNLSSAVCRKCKKEIENVHEPGIHGTR